MNQKLPQHVAIVMDGNGRWAEKQGLPRVEGHRAGAQVVRSIVECCVQKKIPVLSLFAFSSENWARPGPEVDFLMQLFMQALEKEVQALHANGVCLRFVGDRSRLSPGLCEQMALGEKLTVKNTNLVLNVLVNYSGKWDIVQAARAAARQVVEGQIALDALNEHVFSAGLSLADLSEPDLFIRTSGEQRISNFFLWQLAYTELYFSSVPWPEFSVFEFTKALACFSTRERRYGQLNVGEAQDA